VNAPKWWLRCKLRYAARLLKKNVLNRWQYSALAIKLGYGIWRKPLTKDTRLEQYPFSLALGSALGLKTSHSEFEYRDLLEAYGPFNEAITLLIVPLTDPPTPNAFNWNSDQENRAKAAALQLSPFNRAAFRIQVWWAEQEQLFPLFTKMTVFIAGLLVGGVVGIIIGRITH